MMNEVIEAEKINTQISAQPQRNTSLSATPADLVRYAMESGADLDRLERLMEMQIKWEKREAEKAFTSDMAEFKKNPPEIFKDKRVSFLTGKGTTEYDHATIGNVVEKVIGGLAAHGFSHRWVPGRTESGLMTVTCVITHRLGHSQETTLEGPSDQSGGKNSIQAVSSTNTYLQRYSLLMACGLATKDVPDDDGRGSESKGKEKIRHPLGAKGFAAAIEAVKTKGYDPAKIRSDYALTVDQETVLSDVEKEIAA